MKKYIALIVLFFVANQLTAQWSLVIEAKVVEERKVLFGSSIEVFSDSHLIQTIRVQDQKTISIALEPDHYYQLHFIGPGNGYYNKRVDVDTRNVNASIEGNNYFPLDVTLFKKVNEKLDYSGLKEPLSIVYFDNKYGNFDVVPFKGKTKLEYDQLAIDRVIASQDSLNKQVGLLEEDLIKKSKQIKEREKELIEKEKEVKESKEILTKLSLETLEKKEKLNQLSSSYEEQRQIIEKAKQEYGYQSGLLIEKEKDLELALENLNAAKNEYDETKKQMTQVSRLLENQKSLTYLSFVILIIISILGALAFKNYRKQKSQAQTIALQKDEVEKQKEIVEEAHKEITDSIAYAKRIQSAILPPLKLVKEHLNESFILYKPKDVVAGDFYWMMPYQNRILFAAADCTGHGVPGAMVSVVCNNGLNRSVREHGLTDPGQILDKTREIVISEFEKSEDEVKDGMDVALCSLEGNTLQYAGAHNPLYIIRKGATEVEEIKANKQPIGKFDQLQPYTTHKVELNAGDSIYVFSDGFVDQFGGEKGKKLKSPNFRKLLLGMQDKSMEQQHQLLDQAFEDWKGPLEQIDDVCLIGVRL